MEHSRPVLAVFDLGEVLATPPHLLRRLSQRLGVEEAALSVAYWRHRDGYDRGSSAVDYWGAVAGDLDLPMTEGQAEEIAAFDADAWTEIRQDAREVLETLSEANVRVAVLSNAPWPIAESISRRAWSRLVERVFVSAELGTAKPDPEVYTLVAKAMDTAPPDILFLDDRPENVEAARRAGWDAVQWHSPDQMRAALAEHGLPVPSAAGR